MAIIKLCELEPETRLRYTDEYRRLVNDPDDVLCSFTIELFSKLTDLALNHLELDKSTISNYDFEILARLMVNGHLKFTPEVAVSRDLWKFMTDILFDVDVKEV